MPFGVDLPKVPDPQEFVDAATDFVEDATDAGTQLASEGFDFFESVSHQGTSIIINASHGFIGILNDIYEVLTEGDTDVDIPTQ